MRRRSYRISNLPCSIIDNILKYLPLRDAVRTSILSSEWEYKWVTIPHLVFDWNFEDSLKSKYKLESVIDRTLLLHKGALTKFSLTCHRTLRLGTIKRWLFILLDHQIEDLALSIPGDHVMPLHLLGFDHLKHLHIEHFTIKGTHTFRGITRLARLVLVDVFIQLSDLIILLSKCPMLEYLNLESCNHCGELEKLPDKVNHLKVLKFGDGFEFGLQDHVTCIVSLIRRSPNLRSLEIHCCGAYEVERPVLGYLQAQQLVCVSLGCLEDVNIDGISGIAEEMEFLKILLRWATALEKLNIESVNYPFAGDVSKFLDELARFRRASIQAEIIFHATWDLSYFISTSE